MELEIWVWHEGGVGSLSGSLKFDVTGVSTRTKTNTDTEKPTKSPTTPTIRQGSVTQLKNLVKLPSGKRTYQLTGGCVLNARKTAIIAPKKKATCRLTVTGKAGKKTAKVKATLRVSF